MSIDLESQAMGLWFTDGQGKVWRLDFEPPVTSGEWFLTMSARERALCLALIELAREIVDKAKPS